MSFDFQNQALRFSIFNERKYTSSFDLLMDKMSLKNPVSANYQINNSMNNAQNTQKQVFLISISLFDIKYGPVLHNNILFPNEQIRKQLWYN